MADVHLRNITTHVGCMEAVRAMIGHLGLLCVFTTFMPLIEFVDNGEQ